MKHLSSVILFLILAVVLGCSSEEAERPLRVGVAANFLTTFREIATAFEEKTGHALEVTSGSTGSLYAQIVHGAPIDVFFSADRRRPQMLEEAGLIAPDSRRTYARGRLALVSERRPGIENGAAFLRRRDIRTVALANSKTAPYGLAARQVLQRSDLGDVLDGRLVEGTSVGQVFAMVTAEADAGFVAWSQALVHGSKHVWVVPETLHDPIDQDVVITRAAADDPRAGALLEFLAGDEAAEIIRRHGYGADDR